MTSGIILLNPSGLSGGEEERKIISFLMRFSLYMDPFRAPFTNPDDLGPDVTEPGSLGRPQTSEPCPYIDINMLAF